MWLDALSWYTAGMTVHVIPAHHAVRVRERDHPLQNVAMVESGKLSVMPGCKCIRGVRIHSVDTQVNISRLRSLTISNPASSEAKTMKATTNHCVAHVTTTRRLMMAAVKGVGANKVLAWGWRPAGQSYV